MIDEITGDDGGVEFLSGISKLVKKYEFRQGATRTERQGGLCSGEAAGRVETPLSPLGKGRGQISLFAGFFETEAREALVEAGDLAAGIEHLAGTADPGRVRRGIDVESKGIAFLAVGRARLIRAAVGHLDGDGVIVGVDAGLHGGGLSCKRLVPTSL